MLEENKIVDQAQQVMEKLCTIAKTNCEKHFIADQEKKRKMYTQEELKEHIREKWTSELVTTTQIRKFLTAVNTVTEKVNAYKLENMDKGGYITHRIAGANQVSESKTGVSDWTE